MGLDVYLYRYKRPLAEVEALTEKGSKLYETVADDADKRFGKYEDISEERREDREAWVDGRMAEQGFDRWGEVTDDVREKVERDSAVHPKHMFKIGYFRSSYNESGTNRFLSTCVGRDLYSIFEGAGRDQYAIAVDWADALRRARSLRDDLAAYLKRNGGYSIHEFTYNCFSKPAHYDTKTALEAFHAERERHEKENEDKVAGRTPFTDYSNSVGTFLWSGTNVVGVIQGTKDGLLRGGPEPVTYLIAKSANDDSDAWYMHALEIVVETCEWVLGHQDPSSYVLHWSG